jgi:dipeptidyl aminopeptidase/acylaminoacyl peptidase
MVTLKKYDVDPILPWRPVSELALSPTKKDILFTRTITDDEKNKYKSNIWIISILNSTIKQFTSGNGNDSNPMWSPNCDTIYFLSNRKTMEEEEEKTRLWTISYHGGEAQLVAEAKHSIEGAKLAPDGKKILFFSNVEEESEAREDSNETDVLFINATENVNLSPIRENICSFHLY